MRRTYVNKYRSCYSRKNSCLATCSKKSGVGFYRKFGKRPTPLQRLGQIIDKEMANVPKEVLESLPIDGSENLDHYLYGTPKK